MKHPLAWLLWITSITICAWSSRNPYVLVLLLLVINLVRLKYDAPTGRPKPSSLHWMLGIGVLFNALWTHAGDTVVARLPESLPLIGGPITAEALIYGLVNAAALLCMLQAFDALQRALPVSEILRMAPRALHPITVVVIIAVTYVPMARRRAEAVRAAQAVRGHEVRRLRDWMPLLMPLLIGALEHAMQLAEAMAARGYGRSIGARDSLPSTLFMVGLLILLAGWVLDAASSFVVTGRIVMAAGAATLIAALWVLRGRAPRTSLHQRTFTAADIVGTFGAAAAALTISGPFPTADAIAWTPYPMLQWPEFPMLLGPVLFGLCLPAFFAPTEGKPS